MPGTALRIFQTTLPGLERVDQGAPPRKGTAVPVLGSGARRETLTLDSPPLWTSSRVGT